MHLTKKRIDSELYLRYEFPLEGMKEAYAEKKTRERYKRLQLEFLMSHGA